MTWWSLVGSVGWAETLVLGYASLTACQRE